MDYEKKYKEAFKRAKGMYEQGMMPERLEYVFPELKESEDEKIKKWLIELVEEVRKANSTNVEHNDMCSKALAWIEKQAEHANFRNKIQIGDKVTRNRDGYLVNLSQLNRVAKKDKKQGEQKPAWSEEDEIRMDNLYYFLEEYGNQYYGHLTLQGTISWLKSLKERYTWKPSDEQMEALANALSLAKNCGEESAFDLRTLYEQLKNLTE